MAISFIQDTLISQPLKVVIVALIFAVFFKSADDEDYFEESQSAQGLQNFNIKRLTKWNVYINRSLVVIKIVEDFSKQRKQTSSLNKEHAVEQNKLLEA